MVGLLLASHTYNWTQPVYDRTQADVDRQIELNTKGWFNMTAEEKAEWAQGKGAINSSDIERVEHDIGYLASVFGYTFTIYDTAPYCIDEDYASNLIGNLEDLRDTGFIYPTTPQVPSKPFKSFETWNAVEKILSDIYSRINSHVDYESIDDLQCGDEVGLIL